MHDRSVLLRGSGFRQVLPALYVALIAALLCAGADAQVVKTTIAHNSFSALYGPTKVGP